MIRSWLLAIAGLAAFAIVVWLAGPLLVIGGQAPLVSAQVRALVIAAFVLQYLGQKLWSVWKGRRSNDRIVAGLTPKVAPESAPEAALLRERFANALAELRRARFAARGPWRFGKSYLYELPWYVIIGSPGTGKTTALLNSGLSFPLAEKLGRGSVGGFGGTRNCDWWFTDRAVLIDTAGRYTTQDSDQTADRQGWEAFLELLRATRPRQPLNGVLVAVSVSDLLELSQADLSEHVRILRARLEELQNSLRVRLPVYLLVTKCDLLPGFVDWFGPLGRKDRDQPWGVTLPLAAAGSAGVATFAGSYERLVEHLADGLVERLQAERDPQRRARIFSLPGQLRGLSEPLGTLIRQMFGPADSAPGARSTFLRGLYLTSGTQAGTPIDRLLYAFGRELGLERQILPPNQSTGKSFFLGGMLNDVVLAEAGLTGGAPTPRWRRRLLIATVAAIQLGAAALAAWWLVGYSRGAHAIAELDTEVARARSMVYSIPASGDPDPRPLLPALDTLRELARGASRRATGSALLDIGARTNTKLTAAARQGYDRVLLGPFQSRVATAIDTTLRRGADVNVQYEALKAYQMLGDARHFDADGLRIFVLSYWDSALAPPLSDRERKDMAGHLDALLEAGAVGSGTRVDPLLVASVRERLRSQSNAQRIALRLTVALNSHDDPDFTIASLGPTATELFVGADATSPPKAIPGRYTVDAFRDVVSGQVQRIADELASESGWVLGVARPDASADAAQVFAGYRAEYGQAWGQLLQDLHLRQAATNDAAVKQAQTLSRADGPLELVLGAIVLQTPLRLPNGAEAPIAPSDPAADRFTALANLFVRDASGASPIDGVMRSFLELQTLRALPARQAAGQEAGTRIAHVIASAKADPEPVSSMLLSLAVLPAANGVAGSGAEGSGPAGEARPSAGALSRQIAARLEGRCLEVVAGRFPFERRSTRDASFDDFSRLFAPQGAFDDVYRQLLAAHVDISSGSWQWRGAGSPGPEELERFRAATRIREVFFPHGGNQPTFELTFRPVDMDESIDRFLLEIDGQTVRYAHGPPAPTVVKWPGSQGSAHIELSPAAQSPPPAYTGSWALFRLLDHAAVQDTDAPGHFKVVFDVGGRHATFDVASDDGADPFRLRELEHFDCPIASR
jgi:type VI secretion system protein ImpL